MVKITRLIIEADDLIAFRVKCSQCKVEVLPCGCLDVAVACRGPTCPTTSSTTSTRSTTASPTPTSCWSSARTTWSTPPRAMSRAARSTGCPSLKSTSPARSLVLKRSLNPGFAGLDNELFYKDNTMMLFGDAQDSLTRVIAEIKEL